MLRICFILVYFGCIVVYFGVLLCRLVWAEWPFVFEDYHRRYTVDRTVATGAQVLSSCPKTVKYDERVSDLVIRNLVILVILQDGSAAITIYVPTFQQHSCLVTSNIWQCSIWQDHFHFPYYNIFWRFLAGQLLDQFPPMVPFIE